MIWLVSVILIFAEVEDPKIQYWKHLTFNDLGECRRYINQHKVELTESIFEHFKIFDGKKLKNFEFYCEKRELPEV